MGDRLCPTHANKRGRRYRYYISKRLMHRTGSPDGGWRLPAQELDRVVIQTINEFLRDELQIIDKLGVTNSKPDQLKAVLRRAAALAGDLENSPYGAQRRLLHQLLHRVTLHPDSIHVEFKRSGLDSLVLGETSQTEGLIELIAPVLLKRRGVEAKLILYGARGKAVLPDAKLIALLAQAHRWFDQLTRGEVESAREIAWHDKYDPSEISRTIQLAFLAPDIVEAILAGRQPAELTTRQLMRIGDLPLEWYCQRRLLGFQA